MQLDANPLRPFVQRRRAICTSRCPPCRSWGKKFIAVPFKLKCKDTLRVLASQDKRNKESGGQPPIIINKGEFYEFTLDQTEPSLIESDKPVLVAQYSGADSGYCGSYSDQPSMVIVNPVDMACERAAFTSYEFTPWSNYFEMSCDSGNYGWYVPRVPINPHPAAVLGELKRHVFLFQ